MRLAIGIPSFQEADTISNVVRQVDQGLASLRSPADCVIVNMDSDSPDLTAAVFLNTATECRKQSFVITEQPRGKGRNVLRFFDYCIKHDVEALAIVDGDLRSITPDWIHSLILPVLRGEADYVTPLYLRHRFDGSLTNHFAYPMLRGYCGTELRQPIGGEFGFSVAFLKYILEQPVNEAILGYGIDIFLSMHAALGGFKVVQTDLGRKLHKPSLPKWHAINRQCFGAAIAAMRRYRLRLDPVDLQDSAPYIEETPEYELYEESQTQLAVALARARTLLPVYNSWLDEESGEMSLALDNGGEEFSSELWTDLLSAWIDRVVRIEPRTPECVLADQLEAAFCVRAIGGWNRTWGRPIAEFNDEIHTQARMFREKLLARARVQ